jgi:hypothetical protein
MEVLFRTAAHTLLLSSDLCHVALPNGNGLSTPLDRDGAQEVRDHLDEHTEEGLKSVALSRPAPEHPLKVRAASGRRWRYVDLTAQVRQSTAPPRYQ